VSLSVDVEISKKTGAWIPINPYLMALEVVDLFVIEQSGVSQTIFRHARCFSSGYNWQQERAFVTALLHNGGLASCIGDCMINAYQVVHNIQWLTQHGGRN